MHAAPKLTSAAFSEVIRDVHDLYEAALRNGYFLPKLKSSAVNEPMLFNVLQGHYLCPKYADIKLKACVKPPLKEVLLSKLLKLTKPLKLNFAWLDETHLPDSAWLVAVLATLDPNDEIFRKDYVAPPIRKRLQDIPTIELPKEILEGLPKSKSKVKARRLKVTSEAFAQERAQRMKELRKRLDTEILVHEMRVEDLKERKKARLFDDKEEIKLRDS